MTVNQENLTEIFFSKLKTSTNSGVVLAQFYSAIIGTEIGRSEIIKLNRLVKLFGRNSVFFAIVDIARKEDFTELPYGLLYKICKDKLELSTNVDAELSSMVSLDKAINEMNKEISKVEKVNLVKMHKILDEDERK